MTHIDDQPVIVRRSPVGGQWWAEYPLLDDGTGGVALPVSEDVARLLIRVGASLDDSES